jgi:non-ribosomal peptide synthetase component F
MSGAAVAVTADTLWPPALTCRLMAREGVTMTYVPPGCATQLAEWALAHGAPPTLRSLTVGGEATSREAFALMRRAFPDARIVNGYGPTETVITPMLWMFHPGDDPAKLADSAYLPIGTLVGARTAHVLDARLNPLPSASRAAIWTVRRSRPSASCPIRSARREGGSTGRAISSGAAPTACSISSAASTIR